MRTFVMRIGFLLLLAVGLGLRPILLAGWPYPSEPSSRPCQIQVTTYDGWKAEKMSNEWVTLILTPQLGGRLMQVEFGGHDYLYVNRQLEGHVFPTSVKAAQNLDLMYGGDKLWPLPEGTKDAQHWNGALEEPPVSGPFAFSVLSRAPHCGVRLTGPADPEETGLQYTRYISISSSSPEISFHAVMKNTAGYPIKWSVQSVTQYNLADPQNPSKYNHDFWGYTPINPHSAYLKSYHVRTGPSPNPQCSIRNELFILHPLHIRSEMWVDSPGGWLAVMDGSTGYTMVERFHYNSRVNYPGKATVIFFTAGPRTHPYYIHGALTPLKRAQLNTHYYRDIEAEINSPMIKLDPGKSYTLDTQWFPTRLRDNFRAVTYAGVVDKGLEASVVPNGVLLSGSFGVFFSGHLVVHLYDRHGTRIGMVPLKSVDPLNPVTLRQKIKAPLGTARVSIHLVGPHGLDRGPLDDVWVGPPRGGS